MKIEHMFDEELIEYKDQLIKRLEDFQNYDEDLDTGYEDDLERSRIERIADSITGELWAVERELKLRQQINGILGEKPPEV